jgi:hypothetical protein
MPRILQLCRDLERRATIRGCSGRKWRRIIDQERSGGTSVIRRVYDVASDSWSAALASPAPYGTDRDAFCSGHAHDNTGGVIFQGGLVSYVNNGHGIEDSARYDVASAAWSPAGGAPAHWYPTLVAGVRDMFVFPGLNTQPESPTADGERIFRMPYGTTSWKTTGISVRTTSTYPRVSLLPNGKFFVASPADADRKNYLFDPVTNTTAPAGTDLVPESGRLVSCSSSQARVQRS